MQLKHNSFAQFGENKLWYVRKKQWNNRLRVEGKRGILVCEFLYSSLQACQSTPQQRLDRIEKSHRVCVLVLILVHCVLVLVHCPERQGEISSRIRIGKCCEKLYEPCGRWRVVGLHCFNWFIQKSKEVIFGERIHCQTSGKVITSVKGCLLFPYL